MRISLPSGTPAELVRPPETAVRGLVIFPDIMGLRPLFEEHSRRIAEEQGWVVCALEPFPGREALPVEDRLSSMGTLRDGDKLRDILEAADATGMPEVGLIGFCMGGMYALKAAGTGRFDRIVSFYGMIRVPEAWRGPEQRDAIGYLTDRRDTQVLGIIGTADPWTPVQDVDDLETAGATVLRYEGAEHGFVHDPDRPAHLPEQAAEAWARALAFLRGA